MRKLSCLGWTATFLSIVLISCGGCDESVATKSTVQHLPIVVKDPGSQALSGDCEAALKTVSVTTQNEQLPAEATQQEATPSLLGKASKLLSDAQDVTGQQASSTGQWLQGAWNGASDSTGNAVDGSLDWANETFKSLKDQGLTTASSTGEWLSEDWQNMESWQYKVLATDSVPAAELEGKLNELGKQGWECFSVDDQRMIFKKATESYLRRMPFKDILRLAPLLNQAK